MPMHAALSFFNKSREMGRTKSKSKSKKAALPLPADSDSITSSEPTYTSTDLLAQASVHLISLEYDQAKSLCERAIQLVEAKSGPSSDGSIELTEAFELLGTVELELGELDVAREVSFFLFLYVDRRGCFTGNLTGSQPDRRDFGS
jgi:hypothetical protein